MWLNYYVIMFHEHCLSKNVSYMIKRYNNICTITRLTYKSNNTVNSEIFATTVFSRNGKITLSFIDIGKPCLSREFFTSLICPLLLFAKIKFSRKFSNLQYKKQACLVLLDDCQSVKNKNTKFQNQDYT